MDDQLRDTATIRPYFRGDQASEITGPNLAAGYTYSEHICRARGKRSQFTSISLDRDKIRDFGDVIYELLRAEVDADGHTTVEYEPLLEELKRCISEEARADKARSILALRRAKTRREGLVEWGFDISGVNRKDIVNWATKQVQKYFKKV